MRPPTVAMSANTVSSHMKKLESCDHLKSAGMKRLSACVRAPSMHRQSRRVHSVSMNRMSRSKDIHDCRSVGDKRCGAVVDAMAGGIDVYPCRAAEAGGSKVLTIGVVTVAISIRPDTARRACRMLTRGGS